MPKSLRTALAVLTVVFACHALAAGTRLTPAQKNPTATAAVRREFMDAMQRVRQHVAELPDSPALQKYEIYEYLLAARLRRDLILKPGEDLDAAIDEFLQMHAGQPVARSLKGEWLVSLAGRHRWDWFLPRAMDVAGPQLLCDRLQGRLATGELSGLAAEALARWSLPQKQPPECDAVFTWLRSERLITPELAESRTRAALLAENPRLAREFADDVPSARAAPLLQWARLLEAPKPALALLASSVALPVDTAALEAGFSRLSRTDSAAASNLLPGLLVRPDLTPELQLRLRRMAALGAAYGRDPAALAAFSSLPAEAVDGDVQEWRVRAALWAGDFTKALRWIEQMPASLSAQPRWRYWRARATAATAGGETAAPLFEEIAGLRDFYGYLAADRLHREYELNAHPSADVEAAQDTLAATPGLIRAHALFDCEMADEAGLEWATAIGGAEPAVKVQAAHLAARWGWYAQSIATLAQVGEWDDVRLRYPRPYPAAIAEASRLTQLPADWILAVMRQESLFRSDAVSRAGAHGLMQMLPSTAAAVERRWHLPTPDKDAPFDPAPDVALGAAYLRELLDRYGGQLGLGLAAYNAGPVPVARWLPATPMDADIWIENIPYGETRGYVQRVFEHIVAFAWVRDAQMPRLAELLPRIAQTAPAAAAAQNSIRSRPTTTGPE